VRRTMGPWYRRPHQRRRVCHYRDGTEPREIIVQIRTRRPPLRLIGCTFLASTRLGTTPYRLSYERAARRVHRSTTSPTRIGACHSRALSTLIWSDEITSLQPRNSGTCLNAKCNRLYRSSLWRFHFQANVHFGR